jgi:hypothetical protein
VPQPTKSHSLRELACAKYRLKSRAARNIVQTRTPDVRLRKDFGERMGIPPRLNRKLASYYPRRSGPTEKSELRRFTLSCGMCVLLRYFDCATEAKNPPKRPVKDRAEALARESACEIFGCLPDARRRANRPGNWRRHRPRQAEWRPQERSSRRTRGRIQRAQNLRSRR